MIVFALKEEAAPFRERLDENGFNITGSEAAYRAEKSGQAVDVRVVGPGADNMKEWLQSLGDNLPTSIVHAGFAGALNPDWPRQRLCVIESIVDDDAFHTLESTGERAALETAGCEPASLRSVTAPANAKEKKDLSNRTAADLVDMESATVFDWAREHEVPYTGLRVVSDVVDDELPDAVVKSYDGRRFRTGFIVKEALRRPSLVPELLELRKRSRKLAAKLADTLMKINFAAPDLLAHDTE